MSPTRGKSRLPRGWQVAAFILLAWTSVPAWAYEVSGRSWPQAGRGEPVTLTYSYSNLLDGGLRNASEVSIEPRQILSAIEEAFSVWAGVAPLHFSEVADQGGPPATSNYPPGQYGDIRLGYGPLDGRGNFKAQAAFPPARGQTTCTYCGDVLFDVQERWETIGTLDLPDILGAAIHEIGHSLGIAHTDIDGANMFPVFRRHTGPGSGWLHPDDVAAIHAIYGQGIGSVTPLARVPEPASWALIFATMLGTLPWIRSRFAGSMPSVLCHRPAMPIDSLGGESGGFVVA